MRRTRARRPDLLSGADELESGKKEKKDHESD
jgi:hypothetical protein